MNERKRLQRRAPADPGRRLVPELLTTRTPETVPVVHRRPQRARGRRASRSRSRSSSPRASTLWRILPSAPGRRRRPPASARVRADPGRRAAPQEVGGDVKLATFNVLNFFPTTGEEFVTAGLGTCTYFTDRDGNHDHQQLVQPQRSSRRRQHGQPGAPAGQDRRGHQHRRRRHRLPRGARELGQVRQDRATSRSTRWSTALNADAGPGTWAAVPSAADLPPPASRT